MVASLSKMTRLESLIFGFESRQSRPDRRSQHDLPLQTRTILPVLAALEFVGVIEYLDDFSHFIARIDAPLLN